MALITTDSTTPLTPIETDNENTDTVEAEETEKKRLLSLKIGMLGDAQVGKTTLMVKYVKSKVCELIMCIF